MVFGVARLIGGLLLVFVAVLLHHLGRQEPLLSYWPHTFRLVGLLHGLIRGAVYLWVACFLRTSMVIYLFDRAPRPLNDATLGRALLAEPGSVLAGLRNSSILAVARRDVPRALLLGLGTAVAVLFACVLGLLAIHAVRSTPHPFAPSQPGLRSTLLTDVTSPGDSLVHAVKDYRAHHGRYPQALSDIPSDVRDVLSTPRQARGSWDYSPVLQGRGFQLSIELPADPMMGTVGYRTVLCYRSDDHYADAAFGGKLVERFGEWAFYGD
jgi:hypothetical protein